jgi:aldehyde dehydrogenase (NAD+)
MAPIQAKNFINGRWCVTAQTFESLNPADTREVVGTAPISESREANAAVAAAGEAFKTWREKSWIQRAEYIDRFAQLLKRDLEEFAQLVTRECGKPLNEGRADVVEALHMAQYAAGLGRMPTGFIVSSEIPAKDSFILRKPKGVVVCITPWNFPVAIPLWGTLPSLVAGNTVILKPSEETPICGHKIAELFEEAGFPKGVVNVVHGYGDEIGDAFVKHQDVNVILFTGSREIGKYVQRVVAKDLYKFAATEMGGKNAILVLEDANLELAVHASLLSCFKTSGQRCTAASRLIVDKKIEPKFTDMFLEKVKRIRVGNGLNPDVFMGPLINQEGVEKWNRHNQKAIEEGAEVLYYGKELTTEEHSNGHFVEPFVYRFQYKPNTFCLREEAFSPHVAIIPVDGLEEAVQVYNDTDYGLSLSVITEDYRKWRWVRDHAEFGIGYVNLPTIGAEIHLPFGGVKGSGNGHPGAEGIIDAITHRVAFTVNHATDIAMPQGLSTAL